MYCFTLQYNICQVMFYISLLNKIKIRFKFILRYLINKFFDVSQVELLTTKVKIH